jgi:lipopolysaccharide transport system ATP-binding protein
LAVGDLGFRYKCFMRVGQIIKNAAVIFVSHDMPSVSRLATTTMLMNEGKVEAAGTDNAAIIQKYNDKFPSGGSFREGTGDVVVSNVKIYPPEHPQRLQEVEYGKDTIISFEVDFVNQVPEASVTVNILDKAGTAVAQLEAINLGFKIENRGRKQRIEALFKQIPLSPGDYSLWIIIGGVKEMKPMAVLYGVSPFSVKGSFIGYIPFQPLPEWRAF